MTDAECEQHWNTFFNLLELSEARFADWHLSEIRPELDRRLKAHPSGSSSTQRSLAVVEIYRETLSKQTRKRIEFYSDVAIEHKQVEVMYAIESLEYLKDHIMRSVKHACAAARDRNGRASRASGDGAPELGEHYYTKLSSDILNIVNARLKVLKAERGVILGVPPHRPRLALTLARQRVEIHRAMASLGVEGVLHKGPPFEPLTSNPVAIEAATDGDSLRAQRAKLLETYKQAAKNPSNRRIYTSRNSGIHKPEFYDWVKGVLRSDSSTCQTFERFLREGKPPIPRKAR